jgi:integral membrane protein (TIGR01906 family)
MRRATTWIVGFGLALFLIGVSVVPLTIPAFTKYLSLRTSLAKEAGLSPSRMAQIAEQVRQFVVDGEPDADASTLPAVVDGRAGFDGAAVSHLRDVSRVLARSRTVTGVLAVVLVLGLGYEVARKRTDRIADALTAGAVWSVALVIACVVVATTNFDWFFSEFHGLFFKSGTWTFSYGSLLIRTFPEPFWMTAGEVWGGLVVLGAAALAAGAWALRRGTTGPLREAAE